MDLAPGERIGRYIVLDFIDRGAMGEVYKALDPRLGREVAIKVLPEGFRTDSDRLLRLSDEARTAAALNHPNIFAVYDVAIDVPRPYIVSELLEGATLRALLEQGPLSIRQRLTYIVQLCHGLDAAHRKGIVHRDLKPENIFITAAHIVKILDFGVAKFAHQVSAGVALPVDAIQVTEAMTQVAAPPAELITVAKMGISGTLQYMSPEQTHGDSDDVDWRSDLYAVGVIGYELLAGRLPYELKGRTAVEIIETIRQCPPIDLNHPKGLLGNDLQEVLRKALAKDKTRRYQSAKAFADDVENVISSLPISAANAGGHTSLWRWAMREERIRQAAFVDLALAGITGAFHLGWTLYAVAMLAAGQFDVFHHPEEFTLHNGGWAVVMTLMFWLSWGLTQKPARSIGATAVASVVLLGFTALALVGFLPDDVAGELTDERLRTVIFSIWTLLALAALLFNSLALLAYKRQQQLDASLAPT